MVFSTFSPAHCVEGIDFKRKSEYLNDVVYVENCRFAAAFLQSYKDGFVPFWARPFLFSTFSTSRPS